MRKNIRIIPRLDIKGPNVIKGIQFEGHRVLGTPEVLAAKYYLEGADELIFQDTVASLYRRNSVIEVIQKTASQVFIPITVAGGIRSTEDMREILRAGADKVAINTAALENPMLLRDGARMFGSQCIMVSLEVRRLDSGSYELFTDYGRQPTGKDAFEWAKRAVDLGVGEILITSVDREGRGRGFDLELVQKFSNALPVPVIACGGAGDASDVNSAIQSGADAVSCASIFHYYYTLAMQKDSAKERERYKLRFGAGIDTGNLDFIAEGYGSRRDIPVKPMAIPALKKYLLEQGVNVRYRAEGGGSNA